MGRGGLRLQAVRERLGLDQASSLLGHADTSNTLKHYAGPQREVPVDTAHVLEEMFPIRSHEPERE